MSRVGLYLQVEREQARRLRRLAGMSGVSEGEVIATVLDAYFAVGSADPGEQAVALRLDALVRQLEHLERDQTVLLEMLAFFIRNYFSTAAASEGDREAAHEKGRLQFEEFVERLARELPRSRSLAKAAEKTFTSEASRSPSVEKRVIAPAEVGA